MNHSESVPWKHLVFGFRWMLFISLSACLCVMNFMDCFGLLTVPCRQRMLPWARHPVSFTTDWFSPEKHNWHLSIGCCVYVGETFFSFVNWRTYPLEDQNKPPHCLNKNCDLTQPRKKIFLCWVSWSKKVCENRIVCYEPEGHLIQHYTGKMIFENQIS